MGTKDIIIGVLGAALIGAFAFNIGNNWKTIESSETPKLTKAAPIERKAAAGLTLKVQKDPNGQLAGTWLQAKNGGEDGKTCCIDAEQMTSFNGGSTVTYEINTNQKISYVLWYDNSLGSGGDPTVNAAYNEGRWTLEGKTLSVARAVGATRTNTDMGEHDATHNIKITGNVLKMSPEGEQETTDRFVRCV